MQRDVEIAFGNLGIAFDVFEAPFKMDEANRDKFKKDLIDKLRASEKDRISDRCGVNEDVPDVENVGSKEEDKGCSYDAIFSLNFKEEVAECAYEAGVAYIAWIYDCPFGVSQSDDVLRLPTNKIISGLTRIFLLLGSCILRHIPGLGRE